MLHIESSKCCKILQLCKDVNPDVFVINNFMLIFFCTLRSIKLQTVALTQSKEVSKERPINVK